MAIQSFYLLNFSLFTFHGLPMPLSLLCCFYIEDVFKLIRSIILVRVDSMGLSTALDGIYLYGLLSMRGTPFFQVWRVIYISI